MKSSAIKAIFMVNFCALAVTIFAISQPLQSTYKIGHKGESHAMKPGQYVYHICPLSQWENAKKSGYYTQENSPFIHLLTDEQLTHSSTKLIPNEQYVLLTIEYKKIMKNIKWEGDNASFPNFYGDLPIEVVTKSTPLTFNSAGKAVLQNEVSAANNI